MKVLTDRTAERLLRLLRAPAAAPTRRARIVAGAAGAARGGDVVLCRVAQTAEGAEWDNGVLVDLFENGYDSGSTESNYLFVPEIGRRTCARGGMGLLAHKVVSFELAGRHEDPSEEEA